MRRLPRCRHAAVPILISVVLAVVSVLLLLLVSCRVVMPTSRSDQNSLLEYLQLLQPRVTSQSHPRVVYYGHETKTTRLTAPITKLPRVVPALGSSDCCHEYQRFYQDDAKWEPACRSNDNNSNNLQYQSYPTTCQLLHALDTTAHDSVLLGAGAWRMAWSISHYKHDDDILVKQLRLDKVDGMCAPCVLRKHVLDAYLLSQLGPTWAVSVFGNCGNSILVERAPETLEEYLAKAMNKETSAIERLRLAVSATRALAALHHLDVDSSLSSLPTVAWMDVKASNFVMVQGSPKISDLNVALVLRHHSKSSNNSVCRYDAQKGVVKDFVPEAKTSRYINAIVVDIYRLGHDVLQLMLVPRVEAIQNGTAEQRAYLSMQHVVAQCMYTDPERRPSSRQMATLLEAALNDKDRIPTTS